MLMMKNDFARSRKPTHAHSLSSQMDFEADFHWLVNLYQLNYHADSRDRIFVVEWFEYLFSIVDQNVNEMVINK